MKHYVRVPYFEQLAAKELVEKLFGVRPQNYPAGPHAWFIHVEEPAAIALLVHIPGSDCKTIKLEQPIESSPDSENILTPTKRAS